LVERKIVTKEDEASTESLISEVGRAVGRDVIEEGKSWLRWALGGAIVGALGLGGLGVYLFGVEALIYGVLIGAVIGAIGAWLLYIYGTSY
jgi:energy-converting hydrogenase Eha subunit A